MTQNVLLYTSSMKEAHNEILSSGGRVPLQLSDKVLVAALSDKFDLESLKFSTMQKPDNLDENSETMIRGFKTASKKISGNEFSAANDTPLKENDEPFLFEGTLQAGANTPPSTSSSMTGKIAVAVVVVSGPASAGLEITKAEGDEILSKVIGGNLLLQSSCFEANMTFYPTYDLIPITALPAANPNCSASLANSRACEEVFRNPALKALNCAESYAGVEQLVQRIINLNSTNWGYVVFFSKYPTEGPAYAYGINIYMTYPSSNPNSLDIVYAHETCHIFGAADEYDETVNGKRTVCKCENYGTYPTPNNNCAICPYTPKVGCLMWECFKSQNLCNWTRGQIGWGYWNLPFKKVKNYTSSNSPSLASSSDRIYIAFNGKGDNHLYTEYSLDNGVTWSNTIKAGDYNAEDSPSLLYVDNLLFMVWRGDNTSKFRLAYSGNNGSSWTRNQTNYETSKSPSITFFNSRIFAAWVDKKTSVIQIMYTVDKGKSWILHSSGYPTTSAPSLATFKNQIYLTWLASDGYIHIAYSPNGVDTWTEVKTNFKTNQQPAIVGFYNRLYLASKDANSSNILYGSSSDGSTWGEKLTAIDSTTTNLGVGMVVHGSNLYMAITDGSGYVMTDNFIPGAI